MLTVRALVEDRALRLRPLVAGEPGALDAEVLWVHNTELPDPSPYLRERELVLTNGLWRDAVSAEEFVRAVHGAGAAGVVFGLREQTPVTPPDLVEACRRVGLPLVEIAVDVPFTAVTRAAAAVLAQARTAPLLGRVRLGDALTAAISRGRGADGVLEVVRRSHDLPLVVVDRAGRQLAATDGLRLDDRQSRVVARALARRPPPLEVDLGELGGASLFLVVAVAEVDAALVCLRPVRELDEVQRDALEQAARYLSVDSATRRAVQEIQLRYAHELLDMILSGPARAGEVAARLRAFGVGADGELVVCAVAFTADDPPAGLAEVVSDFFLGEGTATAVAAGSRDVVAVLPWRRTDQDLRACVDRLLALLDRRFPGGRAVVGLGGRAADATALRQPLLRSREACRVLRRRATGPRVAGVHELGAHRLLLDLLPPDTVRGFADAVLAPLREHGPLLAAVRALLRHDGQYAAAARALGVHENTLRQRMAKVEQLTGRDVRRTEDRVDLFLALEAADYG